LANKCEQRPLYLQGGAGRAQQQQPKRYKGAPGERWEIARRTRKYYECADDEDNTFEKDINRSFYIYRR
jgi:hypothetical protein